MIYQCHRRKTTLICVTHLCHWDLLYDARVTGTGQNSSLWHIGFTGTFCMKHVSPGQDNNILCDTSVSLGPSVWRMCQRDRTTIFSVTHLCHLDLLCDACVTGIRQRSSVWHICVTGTFCMTHVSPGQDNTLLYDTSVSLGPSVWCMCHRDRTTIFCVTHLCHWDLLYDACVTGTGKHSSVWHIRGTGTFYMKHVSPGQDNTLLCDTTVSLGSSVWSMFHRERKTLFCVTHLWHWDLLYDACVNGTGKQSSLWHICVTGTFCMTHVSPGLDNTLCDICATVTFCMTHVSPGQNNTLLCDTSVYWDLLYEACVTGTGQSFCMTYFYYAVFRPQPTAWIL